MQIMMIRPTHALCVSKSSHVVGINTTDKNMTMRHTTTRVGIEARCPHLIIRIYETNIGPCTTSGSTNEGLYAEN